MVRNNAKRSKRSKSNKMTTAELTKQLEAMTAENVEMKREREEMLKEKEETLTVLREAQRAKLVT